MLRLVFQTLIHTNFTIVNIAPFAYNNSMGKIIFIAGTDTTIGKSVITGLFARFLVEQGYSVITQKWVQTGVNKNSLGDIETHLHIMGKEKAEYQHYLPLMLPYSFPLPASPHLAASLAKRTIEPAHLIKSTKTLVNHFDYVLVEGTGGLLVPLTEQTLLIDIVKKMFLPVILVAGNKLGALNHTLLSIEALKKRKIKLLGIVWNTLSQDENQRILKDNPFCVENITGVKNLGILLFEKNPTKLQKQFFPIGLKILRH